jgi:RNA recognition motif-containing protein
VGLELKAMSKKIYVGNLPYSATEEELRALFGQYGEVDSVAVVKDRETGQARGFGFVEMEPAAASKAIEALDGSDMQGRTLKVNEAKPREDRGGGGRRSRW